MINALKTINALDINYTGKGITIVVLDTGVYSHIDLRNRILFFKDFINNRSNNYDDNGHGTHICGILSGQGYASNGKIKGIAKDAELIMLKVLDRGGNGSTAHFINALNWIIENKRKYDIRLLNFSVGFVKNANYREEAIILKLINKIWDQGIAVVSAAGNNGPNTNSITVPGVSPKIITVGAIGENFSGKGPTDLCIVKPEIIAPGTNIISLCNRGSLYITKSGTSMATPIVCGALALALEKNRRLTPKDLKIALYKSVNNMNEDTTCWGALDVKKLLENV